MVLSKITLRDEVPNTFSELVESMNITVDPTFLFVRLVR